MADNGLQCRVWHSSSLSASSTMSPGCPLSKGYGCTGTQQGSRRKRWRRAQSLWGSQWVTMESGGGTPAAGEGVQSQGQDTCRGMGTGNMHSPWLLPATLYDCPGGSRGREVQAEPTTQAQGTSPTAATYSRGAGRQQGSGQVGKGARRERGDTVTTSGICSPATHVSKQREYKPSRAMNHPRLPHPQPPGCISTCSSHPGWAMLFLQGSVCNCKSPSAALYMGCSDSWCHPHPLCHPPVSSVPLPRMPHG